MGGAAMRYQHALMALGVLLLAAGCAASRPIVDVTDAPVVVSRGKQLSTTQVRDAIMRAGRSLGWQMTASDPGLITGRLDLRRHAAVIGVRYNAKTYSILYKDSSNLDYQNGQIHKNYHGWIENLDRSIRNELAAI